MSGQNPAPSPLRTRHPSLTLSLLAFAQLIIALDYNIVFVALPDIGHGLDFNAHTLQWVVSAYAVFFGGFLLLGGRAADLFGRRRMFVVGMSLYAIGSLLGGVASSPSFLIGARGIQGLGGAVLAPATLSLVTTTFAEGRERNRALAVWGGAGGTGMVLGSLLGGVLTDVFGWQSVFFVNVLLAAAGMLLAFLLIPADGRHEGRRTFDLSGAVTATAGSCLLVFGLVRGPQSGWTTPATSVSLGLAALLLLAFFLIESRLKDPLMPLRLFRNRNLSTGTTITFLFMATFGALAYFLTLYFQQLHHYSPLRTGFAFVLPCAAVLVGTVIGGKLATQIGLRPTLFFSHLVGAVGMLAFAMSISAHGSYLGIAVQLAILSVAQGVVFTAMYAAATTGVAGQDQGIASGIATTGQQVGGAVGLAILIGIASSAGLGSGAGTADLRGIRIALYVAAAGIALTAAVALMLRSQKDDFASASTALFDMEPVEAPLSP
jgi:EmrB/QacA subfamily drug resistance transporter